MSQRHIINGSAVHLTNITIRLNPKTFFVYHTFESGRDLPEARELYFVSQSEIHANCCSHALRKTDEGTSPQPNVATVCRGSKSMFWCL